MSEESFQPVSPYWAGFFGRCPRCGKASMFKGILKLVPACEACGLDMSFADAGDGPAIFVMTIAGFIVLGVAAWLEIAYEPPFWLTALIITPFAALVCVGLLRPTKGLLVALQYAHKAEEGRLSK